MLRNIALISSLLFIITLTMFSWTHSGYAQTNTRVATDTLTDYFRSDRNHKDGYDFAGTIVDVPVAVAQKCDKKKTRITGTQTVFRAPLRGKDVNGNEIVYQGRIDPFNPDSLIVKSFDIASVSVWNDKSKQWKMVYKKN